MSDEKWVKGSNFDDFLKEDGIYDEVVEAAKERVKELSESVRYVKEYTQGFAYDGTVILCDGLPMTIEEVLLELNTRHDGWISVDDGLPEKFTEVSIVLLGSSGKQIQRTGEIVKATDHDWESDGHEIANCWNVTHWKYQDPLPKPPGDKQ